MVVGVCPWPCRHWSAARVKTIHHSRSVVEGRASVNMNFKVSYRREGAPRHGRLLDGADAGNRTRLHDDHGTATIVQSGCHCQHHGHSVRRRHKRARDLPREHLERRGAREREHRTSTTRGPAVARVTDRALGAPKSSSPLLKNPSVSTVTVATRRRRDRVPGATTCFKSALPASSALADSSRHRHRRRRSTSGGQTSR